MSLINVLEFSYIDLIEKNTKQEAGEKLLIKTQQFMMSTNLYFLDLLQDLGSDNHF